MVVVVVVVVVVVMVVVVVLLLLLCCCCSCSRAFLPFKDREAASGGTRPAIMLENGRRLAGAVRQFGYTYYKIVVRAC